MKIEKRDIWKAEVGLEIRKLAFAVQYEEKGKGSERKRYIIPTNWLSEDNKTLLFDTGKRAKGWIREIIKTVKPSLEKKVQFGLFIQTLPKPGLNPIQLANDTENVTIEDFAPSQTWKTFQNREDYDLNGFPAPEVEHVLSGTTGLSIFRLYFVLSKTIKTEIQIFSLMQIPPESIKSWMDEIGDFKGLGDLHSAPEGYGLFSVKRFEVTEESSLTF